MVGGVSPHRHTILVVEDDADTREAFIVLAESVGLEATGACNGAEALDKLHGGLRPCLIVLDIAMPHMDGFSFRRAQLADESLACLPVAVMSGGGWAMESDARNLGLSTFLRKPVEPEELLRLFTTHCGGGAAST